MVDVNAALCIRLRSDSLLNIDILYYWGRLCDVGLKYFSDLI